ncbi:MAG: IS110 family transposase [Bryobacterales bacterium]|nr:IS110 family transposase [Bryobacterales bacterium]
MKPFYRVAGIDVHKSMLAVVVGVADQPEKDWERRKFGTTVSELKHLAAWLQERGVQKVVMESTAMYWRPVWIVLEPHFSLELAQAQSNRAPHGRKTDFGDALRLVRRLWAGELRLSYVPDVEQRRCRMLCQAMQQVQEERIRVRNQIEVLLEESQIKLSAVVSDLLGASGRLILKALVAGKQTAAEMAEMAFGRLRARTEELKAALEGTLDEVCRGLLDQGLKRIEVLDGQQQEQQQWLGKMQREYASALRRLGQVPGIDVLAAQKILAAVGPTEAAFSSSANLASWVGVCPGRNESAEHSAGDHCPKGYRPLRALLAQAAWAAVRTKGSYFQELFRRWVARMGVKKAIWAIAHRLVCIIWCILHRGDTYVERGALALDEAGRQRKKKRLLQGLRQLGCEVSLKPIPEGAGE